MLKLFGSKKTEKKKFPRLPKDADWSFLKTDMHSHLLPGLDDGSGSIDESLDMIEELMDLGYTGLITTPHIKSDIYRNTPELIMDAFEELKAAMQTHHIDIPIKAAAEYYVDEVFIDMLRSGRLMTLRNKEVLVEFSFYIEPANFAQVIFEIQTQGYTPVIAHPERYTYFSEKIEVFRDLKHRGCMLQLNALSIGGYYGRTEKQLAEKLLYENLYDYCGTDMHHLKHGDSMFDLMESEAFAPIYHYPFKNKAITAEDLKSS